MTERVDQCLRLHFAKCLAKCLGVRLCFNLHIDLCVANYLGVRLSYFVCQVVHQCLSLHLAQCVRVCLTSASERVLASNSTHAWASPLNINCNYVIIHSPEDFSGINHNTNRKAFADCLT